MIYQILQEIANEPSKNAKMAILKKYADNETLKKVLYLANSNRIKYYLRVIPPYEQKDASTFLTLSSALDMLQFISNRNYTGDLAKGYLSNLLSQLTNEDATVIERVILKDLKIGMDSSINKVIPNLIEETPYMGAISYSEKAVQKLFESGKSVYSEIKMDGTYRNAIIENGNVLLLSRSGEVSVLPNAEFVKILQTLPNCVLNGELTIDGFSRYEANGMINSIIDIEDNRDLRTPEDTAKRITKFEEKHCDYNDVTRRIKFTVWDMISIEEYHNQVSITPRYHRLQNLEHLIRAQQSPYLEVIEYMIVNSPSEAMSHFQKALARGLEGTILKSFDGVWKDGKPVWQVKMKLEINLDLRIVGFQYGNKGTKNENVISTLMVESSCGLLKTNPSGMTEAMMRLVTDNQDSLLGSVVEIRCCGLSQDEFGNWSTLHPSVVELRSDKNTCDSLESALEIENMAKLLK